MFSELFNRIKESKLSQDTLFSLAAMALAAGCGALINFIIGAYYNPAALGVFNQVLAVYVFFSQAAVLGVHNSILKYTAQNSHLPEKVRRINFCGLTVIVGAAIISSFLFWICRDIVGIILDSRAVSAGMAYATIGLFFFAINKGLLAVLNGLRFIRTHSIMTACRFIFMALAFIAAGLIDLPAEGLAGILSVAEGALFICLIPATIHWIKPVNGWTHWTGRHIAFGLKSLPSGMLAQLNARVDILMLGFFSGDSIVGVYSLAAITVEVIYQALIALRINVNPVLVGLIASREDNQLASFISRIKRTAYIGMAIVGLVSTIAFGLVVELVPFFANYSNSLPFFIILMIGVIASAGYIPLNQILMQAGLPGWHAATFCAAVAFNAALNAVLIPWLDGYGAALATGLSFIAAAYILKIVCRRMTGIII